MTKRSNSELSEVYQDLHHPIKRAKTESTIHFQGELLTPVELKKAISLRIRQRDQWQEMADSHKLRLLKVQQKKVELNSKIIHLSLTLDPDFAAITQLYQESVHLNLEHIKIERHRIYCEIKSEKINMELIQFSLQSVTPLAVDHTPDKKNIAQPINHAPAIGQSSQSFFYESNHLPSSHSGVAKEWEIRRSRFIDNEFCDETLQSSPVSCPDTSSFIS